MKSRKREIRKKRKDIDMGKDRMTIVWDNAPRPPSFSSPMPHGSAEGRTLQLVRASSFVFTSGCFFFPSPLVNLLGHPFRVDFGKVLEEDRIKGLYPLHGGVSLESIA